MIIVEEKHQKKPYRKRNKNPLDWKIPEVNEPSSIDGWVERCCMIKRRHIGLFILTGKACKASPKQSRYLYCAINSSCLQL